MNLVSLPITAIYAALSGFLIIALAANVVRFRLGKHVSLGDGGHKDGNRAIRAHGNTVEYVPMALLLMALLEANGGGDTALHIYGLLLVGGRILYAYGLLFPKPSANRPRQLGVLTSWIVIVAAGIQLLII